MNEPCASCRGNCCAINNIEMSSAEAAHLSESLSLPLAFFCTDNVSDTVGRLHLSQIPTEAVRRHMDSFRRSHTLLKGADGFCVFLDKGACTVYEHRPEVCREYTIDRCEEIREPLS